MISNLYPFNTDTAIEEMFSLLRSERIRGKYWSNPRLDLDKVKTGFVESGREYCDLIRITLKERAGSEGKTIAGDKSPYNLYRIKTLKEWFPEAKFLHIIRDPRAVFVSEINRTPYDHYFLRSSNVVARLLIFIYICCNWRRNITLYKKYRVKYPGDYLYIRFSILYTQPEQEIKKICDFIGVNFEESMLDPPRRGSNLPEDYDPLNGWKEKIPRFYNYMFELLLGRKISLYS
jgi:hypothetical protein